ncbi:MAG: hypothetical protein H8E73_06125 [Planctomycetes bacterium]|nr:hypothetical protein [Planctomycetota bacterium]MBL7185072.1 hypothetical protein [Phycisphaerae bacterium]
MSNLKYSVVAFLLVCVCSSTSAEVLYFEDFESFDAGTDLHGQAGWEGWYDAAGSAAPVSDKYAFSGTKSIEVVSSADVVQVLDITEGKWVLTAMQYIPSGTSGVSRFHMQNQYQNGAIGRSVQWSFSLSDGVVGEDYDAGASASIIYDEWIELKLIIDLDNDLLEQYYNGELFSSRAWVFSGSSQIQSIDLYGNGASSVYYDDIKIAAPLVAYGPEPADGALHAATWANIKWQPGSQAVSHDVYLSTSFDEVNDRLAEAFGGNQAGTSMVVGFAGFAFPDGLVPGTTYYWRIDEVNDADPNSPWKGDLWSFSVPPRTAYFPDPPDGAEFVEPDTAFSWAGGFGAMLHTVYIGNNFEDVNNAGGGALLGVKTYTPTLEPEKVYYWRVDEFDSAATYKGDIWSFTTLGAVGNPRPANGAADVPMTATLGWTPADNAASHELYFGTDSDAVNNATTVSPEYIGAKALGSESYDPGTLVLNTTYHWRVDAVYPAETVKGLLWSFTAADFLLVDDFESYNDVDPPDPNSNRIFDKWVDGFGTTTNGALVGNELPPYASQAVVRGGAQAMPYFYDNNLKTSEATLTLVYPKDWTEQGVARLSLWFRGDSANAAERMFVALNGNAVVYHDDPSATQIGAWTEWVIDLVAFGVDLANISTITIGFGTKNSPAAGGTGTMYFDDIRLVR